MSKMVNYHNFIIFMKSNLFLYDIHFLSEKPEEKKEEAEGPPVNRSTKPVTVSGEFDDLHGQQSMAYRVRDINDLSLVNK